MSRPKSVVEAQAQPDELAHEQSYLRLLYERLDTLRERARAGLARAQRASGPEGGGGTHQARLERDAQVAAQADRFVRLASVERGLAIGRLDHRDGSRFYVGRIGLSDDDYEPLLIDWRAPAAQPFYRATPAAPGEVVRRRHLRTRGRQVVDYNDDVLDLGALSDDEREHLVGEAALLAALQAGRTGRMGDIVATIQAEQDRIIRADLPGILVVQGGPGTGKTAVALHRAAYLLYTHRERLARRGVLVLGPNPTFLRYIEQVLPSLGETGVLLATEAELYPGARVTGAEPVELATLKGEARMATLLRAAVADRQGVLDGPVDLPVSNGEELRLQPATVAHARAVARASGQPHNQARLVFVAEVVAALVRAQAEIMEGQFDAAELGLDDSVFGPDEQLPEGPVLDAGQLEDLRKDLRQRPAVQSILDRLWPNLTPERLLRDLFASPARLAAAGARAGLADAEVASLAREHKAPWTAADMPLLDEAAVLVGEDGAVAAREAELAADRARELAYASGVLDVTGRGDVNVQADQIAERYLDGRERSGIADRASRDRSWIFGHVIVDEAQELSAMAWRMIVRRCPSRSMTVVGDLAQTGAPGGATSWAAVLDPHAPGRWREERLSVNYRTPSEIMAVAADVLASFAPGLAPPSSVRDGGQAPWHEQVPDDALVARAAELAAEEAAALGEGRMAVLVPAGDLGPRIAEALAAAEPPVVAGRGPVALDAPVAVLTVTEAKGLEFDVVVLVDPDAMLAGSANGPHDLYVAMTRATRRLGVVHSGPLPRMLARLSGRDAPGSP